MRRDPLTILSGLLLGWAAALFITEVPMSYKEQFPTEDPDGRDEPWRGEDDEELDIVVDLEPDPGVTPCPQCGEAMHFRDRVGAFAHYCDGCGLLLHCASPDQLLGLAGYDNPDKAA